MRCLKRLHSAVPSVGAAQGKCKACPSQTMFRHCCGSTQSPSTERPIVHQSSHLLRWFWSTAIAICLHKLLLQMLSHSLHWTNLWQKKHGWPKQPNHAWGWSHLRLMAMRSSTASAETHSGSCITPTYLCQLTRYANDRQVCHRVMEHVSPMHGS